MSSVSVRSRQTHIRRLDLIVYALHQRLASTELEAKLGRMVLLSIAIRDLDAGLMPSFPL